MKNKYSDCDCEFIYSESENQGTIAKKWNDDKLRILISTTLGLVGNESSKTQLVCIVGLLYNIPSIIQSIGRIRPHRRTERSICAIFTGVDNNAQLQCSKPATSKLFVELCALKILKKSDELTFRRSNSRGSVNNWLFSDKGCRMVSLASRLGFEQRVCNLCDRCKNTAISRQGQLRMEDINRKWKQKHECIRLLTRMKLKCIVCNSISCGGNCVVMKRKRMTCYHCLGTHRANQCKKQHINILQNKACFSCYLYNYEGSISHDNTMFRNNGDIRERLRGLINNHYLIKSSAREQGKTFNEFLQEIYTTEETFFDFLYLYKDWK